jgi:hypothetical protein
MATAASPAIHHEPTASDIRLVIAASSAGTIFEWYDFFIYGTLAALTAWLAGSAGLPEWPGIEAIVPARDYPARHGAIMLPWTAACDALSSAVPSG